ncbi:hypothetical protein WT59_21395 [Burkholderia territorii]|nr:hypothetical protein WT59_21395 [Burkholderia territorii]
MNPGYTGYSDQIDLEYVPSLPPLARQFAPESIGKLQNAVTISIRGVLNLYDPALRGGHFNSPHDQANAGADFIMQLGVMPSEALGAQLHATPGLACRAKHRFRPTFTRTSFKRERAAKRLQYDNNETTYLIAHCARYPCEQIFSDHFL